MKRGVGVLLGGAIAAGCVAARGVITFAC